MGAISKLMDQIDESEALAAEVAEQTDTSPEVPTTEPNEPFSAFEAMAEEAAVSVAGAAVGDVYSGPELMTVVNNETADWDTPRVDPAVVTFHNRYASICEQYRSLRARLLSMNPDNQHQVLAVTSAVPEEGKSVTTVNLAIALAEGGEQHVVMVDMDLRRSSLARMLGQRSSPGVADVLRGEVRMEDVVRPTPYPNLKLIAAGNVTDNNYGEVFASPGLRDLLDTMRTSFNYCLLDTPPVTTVSDVNMLGPSCDGALLVIEMGRTPEPAVQVAVRSLQTNNVNILGCVLGRFRDERSHYYDRYYYHYRKD
ncbi:MAG: CpsD/CapB family tyrosine-protein kinase [Phycisphaerae bacterium]|nr:CpsD/CapB family tyrosine-protein kinase [Phycisphaerae bacterium]